MGRANGARNVLANATGRHTRGPTARNSPLAEVAAGDVHRCSIDSRPTPNQAGVRHEAGRKRGQRVYEAIGSMGMCKRLDGGNPRTHRGPEDGFGDDAIELATWGRAIVGESAESTRLAGYGQWESRTRLEGVGGMGQIPAWGRSTMSNTTRQTPI